MPLRLALSVALTSLSLATLIARAANAPLPTVPSVDLARYAGTWYEVARLPNWFEGKCASDVTARYTLRPDGKVTVTNSCRKSDGTITTSQGTAKLRSDKGPNSQLKVTFFWPFYGDYWIIDLDADYQRALIGTPDRKYLWILSRTPQISETALGELTAKAKSLGFATDRLVFPKQTEPAAKP